MNRVEKSTEKTRNEEMKLVYDQQVLIDKLTRETSRLEKDINHIKNSRRFKLSKITRPFYYLKIYLHIIFKGRSLYKENFKLKKELIKKDYIIKNQTDRLNFVERAIRGLKKGESNSEAVLVKLLNEEGLTFDFIDQLLTENRNQKKQIKRIIDQLTRSHRHLKDKELKDHLYQKTAELFKQASFPEYLVRQAENRNLSLNNLDSFSDQLVRRFRLKRVAKQLPETILDDKKTAYEFIDQLNIPYPKQENEIYSINTLPHKTSRVIKPLDSDGGRGVYLVYNETTMYDVKRERQISDWQELLKSMSDDLKQSWVKEDEWYMEELVQMEENQPAIDVKFYCFYGVVGLILEIDRTNKIQYCWWDKEGNMINTGKYQDQLFEGIGVSQEEIRQAIDLSLHIPVPFMRIDYLRTDKGLYFGEFTPKPGNFDQFNDDTDRELGRLYLEAEAKLNKDLIDGKRFTYFNNTINNTRRNI